MRLELLKAYPNLLNAHSKYDVSCLFTSRRPIVLLWAPI
jgi:hypothetical protein